MYTGFFKGTKIRSIFNPSSSGGPLAAISFLKISTKSKHEGLFAFRLYFGLAKARDVALI